jgi:hypothetical protein
MRPLNKPEGRNVKCVFFSIPDMHARHWRNRESGSKNNIEDPRFRENDRIHRRFCLWKIDYFVREVYLLKFFKNIL